MRERFPARRHRFPPLRRGVYLLPSLFTTANIFCGFTAIMMSFQGEFQMAAVLILVATLDPKVLIQRTRSIAAWTIVFALGFCLFGFKVGGFKVGGFKVGF